MLMTDIAIYTLTSELHDEKSVAASTQEFLSSLDVDYVLRGNDYEDYGSHTLSLIYVRTGGTESLFLRLVRSGCFAIHTQSDRKRPFYLLTSGKSNSLAASMEILSWLRQQGFDGEIIHGGSDYIHKRINTLHQRAEVIRKLDGTRLGMIGQPSDWLISSHADKEKLRQTLGIELVDIPMEILLHTIAGTALDESSDLPALDEHIRQSMPVAIQIYNALRTIVRSNQLHGFTVRCFDLLSAVQNTGCLALARLNAEGIIAGCEGDVPALVSMTIAHALTGISGFQANPAVIDSDRGLVTFAHCTIPLNMVEHYELDTHFESGIGIGIRGFMKEGPVTIFKVSGDLTRHFIAEGELTCNESKPDLCRTQQVIRLTDVAQARYFLSHPIGNHHIILPGHHKQLLEEIMK